MKQEEYVKTIVVYGKMVNVGMDDPGQQYFLELTNDEGELIEVGCGAYNTDFESVAKSYIDHRRFLVEEWGEEEVLRMERLREERMRKYNESRGITNES
jgi:hypothetical protein